MSAGGLLRILRAAVFAAVCVALAAAGHVLMSGSGVPWWAPVSAVVAVGAVGWALGGRERGGRTVAGLAVTVQTCLHAAFTLAQSGPPGGTARTGDGGNVRVWARHLLCGGDDGAATAARTGPGGGGHLAHAAHHGVDAGAPTASAGHDMAAAGHGTGDMGAMGHGMAAVPGVHDMGHMTGTASWGMLACHLLAAVLCGLWLAQGERAAFALVRACADRAFSPLRLVLAALRPPPAPLALLPSPRPVRRPRRLTLVRSLPSRGPPGETAVA
ncbi:hypothetical protein [Streptomyces sp. Z26]|uniref:hypothetical protein n=1 Tax=Streptomyces sp. Z26 TaxID=2500177 RepID=UPI000EF15B76|nr:hypothetical protein [Streptomyces sp. Z26]RLL69850.1 hypothetical protein D7M15_27010 [Streptomyces sp. Z26]